MLNRNINAMADLWFCSHDFDQFICDPILIAVHQPNPVKSINPAKLAEKLRQFVFPIQIDAVIRYILRDQNQFLAAGCRKLFCLRQHIFHLLAAKTAANRGNHTVSAVIVTALGNF